MLIVVSNPILIENEANIINSLFEEGMELFHLRKPQIESVEIRKLLEQIKKEYLAKIVLHQHHELADDFRINRLHFGEEKRKVLKEDQLLKLRIKNYILSTSIHSLSAYSSVLSYFDYTFFGPVFNSISKQGYTAAVDTNFVFPYIQQGYPKAIAIGGIQVENIRQAMKMNFAGVAVLGTIWQNPDESLIQFKKVQKEWVQIGQSC